MKYVIRALNNWLIKHDAINPADRELHEQAIYSSLIVIIMIVVCAVLSFIQMERYAICLSVSLTLSSLLQLLCILKKNTSELPLPKINRKMSFHVKSIDFL